MSRDVGHDREMDGQDGAGRPTWERLHLPFRPPLRATNAAFAHPFEVAFARLLTHYRVRWSYEPTTFPIRWDEDDRAVEFMTPDFYLPDHRLYVELTTMRQRLVTRKHRKVRLLRALYPNIRIKILYRRDYLRLVQGSDAVDAPGQAATGRTVIGRNEIAARLGKLAAEIARAFGDDREPPLLVACGPGGRRVLADLAAPLAAAGLAYDADEITVGRYRCRPDRPASGVTVRRRPSQDPAGRRVLVVHGIVSSGLSAAHVVRWLHRRGARDVTTMACLDRRSARLVDVDLRFVGFEAPAELLVGYGLHLRPELRDAPFVATFCQAPTSEVAERSTGDVGD